MTIGAVRSVGGLTRGEREVLRLMAAGLSNQAIADHLVVSPRTVEGRVGGLYDKLGIRDEPGSNPRVIAVLRFLASE